MPGACQIWLLFARTGRTPSWLQANITVGNCVLMLEQADHYKMQKLGEVGSFGLTALQCSMRCMTAPRPPCQAFRNTGSPCRQAHNLSLLPVMLCPCSFARCYAVQCKPGTPIGYAYRALALRGDLSAVFHLHLLHHSAGQQQRCLLSCRSAGTQWNVTLMRLPTTRGSSTSGGPIKPVARQGAA